MKGSSLDKKGHTTPILRPASSPRARAKAAGSRRRIDQKLIHFSFSVISTHPSSHLGIIVTMKLSSFAPIVLSALLQAKPIFAGVEWAGVFSVDDSTHTWSMQKVGGEYADPTMRVVLFATDLPIEETIHTFEDQAAALIEGNACKITEDGETMSRPAATGSCFELHVGTGDDTYFTIDTDGLYGLAVYAQHFPLEFERDEHYLKDSSGVDIEPVAQEGADGHDHDHDDEHGTEKCACMAEELGFAMDCSDTAAMLEALMVLKSSGCQSDCSSPECEKNWYIVQAHHDYCDEDDMPNEIEDDFHDFDEVCESCDIQRAFIEGAPMCPTPNCADDSGNEAYVSLVENDCASDCAPYACRDAFFLLVATHDNCDHDTLSVAAEEGLHDFEDVCTMHTCNSGDGIDQLVCDEDHDDEDDHGHGDHGHDDEDGKMSTSGGASAVGVIGAGSTVATAIIFMVA